MSKTLRIVLLALLGIFVIIQFFQIDKENPPVVAEQNFVNIVSPPEDITKLLKDACYDCHSHETKYPWYTSVAPVSWWIAGHIEEGREHFNLSEWGTYDAEKKAHKAEEAAEEVEEGHMPISTYPPLHPEARLSDAQRERLASWFTALSESKDITEKVRESKAAGQSESGE